MIHNTYPIRAKGSLKDARLVTYIQEYSQEIGIDKRPLILLCPGGGYGMTSDREAEAVALQFLAMGYHAAVLRYSCEPARFPTALLELAISMKLIREHAQEWRVETDRIFIQGCSAGGHLAASYGVFWTEDFIARETGVQDKELLRPNGMILCYPVITSGEFAHKNSFYRLIGDGPRELWEKLSLENQVNADTPKTFIWHTFDDTTVPVENSLMMVGALRRAGISTEFHMYPKGGHGLSLATRLTCNARGGNIQNECATWIPLVKTWIENFE